MLTFSINTKVMAWDILIARRWILNNDRGNKFWIDGTMPSTSGVRRVPNTCYVDAVQCVLHAEQWAQTIENEAAA